MEARGCQRASFLGGPDDSDWSKQRIGEEESQEKPRSGSEGQVRKGFVY